MTTDTFTSAPEQWVAELLQSYTGPSVCPAELLCDRHPAERTAFTVLAPDLTPTVVTYGELREQSERFAAALAELGVQPGDRVATLMGKSVEQLVAVLGIWRAGAVHVPLFTAFAAPAIAMRLSGSNAVAVVTDETQRPKLSEAATMSAGAPWRVIVAGATDQPDDLRFDDLLAAHEPRRAAAVLDGDAPLVQLYTSGTTGRPKAVVVPVRAFAAFHAYMELGLDARPDDVFWNAADPGWAYGHYFGIVGPLLLGLSSIWVAGGFSADLTWQVLGRFGVSNFAAAPTVYRGLRAAQSTQQVRLRCASAAGEPLTPDVNEWAPGALGVAVHDHFGQTEAGMIINNHHAAQLRRPLKPGSMGCAMPGWTAIILRDDADEPAAPGQPGRVAVDLPRSPLAWFTGYLDDPERSRSKMSDDGRWYLTGDTGRLDEDGYFRFVSRDDDVILMAGYRIGPFDVESVLVSHPAVAEAAVVAAPDALRGEVLEAHVVLAGPNEPSDALAAELQQLVKERYAAHAYPRAVHFVPSLPKTPSGKVQRFLLRQQAPAPAGRDAHTGGE
jgi:acetyl-CoA synthetase